MDLGVVRAILETDRVWSAFALADLTAEYREFSEWHVAEDGAALILVYRGFQPPLFFALGEGERVAPLLSEVAGEPELYVSVREGLLASLAATGYRLEDVKTLYRMVLEKGVARVANRASAERLGPGDFRQLSELFEDGDASGERPAFFQEWSLGSGVYFGVREGGTLIAAAGTLVCAPEESVACIGNVYTRRDRRGRGLASLATAAVARELLRRGVRTIALNVRSDNTAAVRIYERLGFSRYCEYCEARVFKDGR